jgi:Icc-related predicted phosphoesterase
MASLCIVADTHRKHRELTIPECDILIHCGDFCSFEQEDEKTLDDVDVWFAEVPAKHVVCVGGNHDFLLQRREFRFAQATFLEDSLIEIDGLSIYGSPWCPDLSGFAYYATEDQLIERWRKIPSGVDILITHTPPYGFLDVPTSGDVHLGCPHLHNELRRIRPRLHVFGHVHASHGAHTEGGTRFVNAAVVSGRNFDVRHAPTMATLTATAEQGETRNPYQPPCYHDLP